MALNPMTSHSLAAGQVAKERTENTRTLEIQPPAPEI